MSDGMDPNQAVVTQADIERGLRDLGLTGGDTVLVHSSMRSFGWIEGGPDAIIDALLGIVGARGCVVMPTLTLGASEHPTVFDVRESPSRSGRVTEVFRKRPGAWRSHHPTGSAAAIGCGAEQLTRYHKDSPCDLLSPYGQVYLRDGYSLFLGAPWSSNTMFHVAEELAAPNYMRYAEFHDATVIDENRVLHAVSFRRYNCYQSGVRRDLGSMGPVFEAAGVVRHALIGTADCRLIRARDNIDISIRQIREHPEEIWSYDR
jgi:aminoglycoside 3-N-acetyltransferase